MRAVAKNAGTTTPTVYERYRDREDILRALRLRTRTELFVAISRTKTLAEACEKYLQFAMDNRHAYEVLFDTVGQPPSLHEPWPSFNFLRDRLGEQMGRTHQDQTRLMLSIWSLLHGAALLIIRGEFEGALRTQTIHASIDAVEMIVAAAVDPRSRKHSGPKWPSNLVLGEGERSIVSPRRNNSSRRKMSG